MLNCLCMSCQVHVDRFKSPISDLDKMKAQKTVKNLKVFGPIGSLARIALMNSFS